MAVSKLTCPECQTVLRPAKPLPPGKPVKCPECGHRFTAPDEAADAPLKKPKKAADDAPRKPKSAGGEGKAAPKKAAVKKTVPDKKPAAASNGEDDDAGTYGFAKTEEEEKPDIEYAPDMSIKDLRGPAQAALVQPSNWLIAAGALGFFGWVGLLIVILIPAVFPIDNDDGDKTKPPRPVIGLEQGLGAVNNVKDLTPPEITNDPSRKSMFNFFGVDIAMFGAMGFVFFMFVVLSPIFFGMAFSACVAYGAVKIQNLEGYGWGVASCIMAMLPFNTFGLQAITAIFLQFLLGMVFDDPYFVYKPVGFAMGVELLLSIGAGVWVLITLRSEKVIKGYEYKAD